MADDQFYGATRQQREPGLFLAEQVRAFDAQAIAAGIAGGGYGLMQRAAGAALKALLARWPDCERVVVLAGAGNNGGDGVELARQIVTQGLPIAVDIWLIGDAAQVKGEAKEALDAWTALEHTGLQAFSLSAFQSTLADNEKRPVVVDALFGTGLSRPVSDDHLAAIDAVNASGLPVLAIDIPSGLQADTGQRMPRAIYASETVAMIADTVGLWIADGPAYSGVRRLAALGVSDEIRQAESPIMRRLTKQSLAAALPRRGHHAHKGNHGHVAVVGGNAGMPGAVLIAARAALRTGSGLVSAITHPNHSAQLPLAQPELMSHTASEHPAEIAKQLSAATVIALGPGLGQDAWGQRVFKAVMSAADEQACKLVIDADALNLLASTDADKALPLSAANTVLTPHPGEAARLLGVETSDIQADRHASVRKLARRYRCTVVLKGAGSLVCAADEVFLCPFGNPGMATGGMGDALTGVIASLMGQGLDTLQAAKVGVLLHALAGDEAAKAGEVGLLPSDLIDAVRAVLAAMVAAPTAPALEDTP